MEMDACRKGCLSCITKDYLHLLTAFLLTSLSALMLALILPGCQLLSPMVLLSGSPLRSSILILGQRSRCHKNKRSTRGRILSKAAASLSLPGIYHIPLLCFLRDKGFDCSVINPIITKNSTNINIRKLHNDKFDSKKAALVGLNVSLKTSILPDDSVVDLRNLVRDYYYFKDLSLLSL